jgi:predicted RNA-binding Zn-ribbon protein involved in translation (DUF1610 family)
MDPLLDPLLKPQPGDPWPCPGCGESDWIAHYSVPESQGIELVVAEDGAVEAVEYDGVTESYDGVGDNEYYECVDCGTQIDPDTGARLHPPTPFPLAFNLPDGGPV